jgi:hypothetical protein
MKDIQTQSEAFINLKFHTNVVKAIFAFYNEGILFGSVTRVLDTDPGTGRQKLPEKREEKQKFQVLLVWRFLQ